MDKKCDACEFLQNSDNRFQILETDYWTYGIGNDHAYLGRGFLTLLHHKPSLSALSTEEWTDFRSIVKTLEPAYKRAFDAEPMNWGCYMNDAYRVEPDNPHVHWHTFPRYKVAQTIGGIVFDDPRFGKFYDDTAQRLVDDEVVTQIADRLRDAINQ